MIVGKQSGGSLRRGVGALIGASLLAGSAVAQGPITEPNWSFESTDGTWVGSTVALGSDGSQVFAEFGAYLNERVLLSAFDSHPPVPVWSDSQTQINFVQKVSSAACGTVHVSLHQEFSGSSSSGRTAFLRKYDLDSSEPSWTYEFPMVLNHDLSEVSVSESGNQITVAIYDSYAGHVKLWVFDPDSAQPTLTADLNNVPSWKSVAFSEDGSTAAFASNIKFNVIDVASGVELSQVYTLGEPNYGGLALSDSGDVLAYGTMGKVRIFNRSDSGSYDESSVHLVGASEFASRVALSGDGLTLGMGLNIGPEPARARIAMIDLVSGSVLVNDLLVGSGTLQNHVSGLELSRDGSLLAVGLWGDAGGVTPEVLAYGRNSSTPLLTGTLGGSVNAIDLSPDGRYIAVASKGTHANISGGGGAFWLYETTSSDFKLSGVPSEGNTVEFQQSATPGSMTRALVSPFLATEPRFFEGVGTLVLDQSSLSFLPGIAIADDNGVSHLPYSVPGGSVMVGSTLFFQGLGLRPRSLTDDYVQMTILP
ncbi:MAG: WD40 repeat protein [Candidatus Paceibacteria bacterium]|jgi:WD40 repeat protein